MSTSGSFTPPATPECAYAPDMTRATALALRTAGQLNPNCVVRITDGPTIGTAGNTSPTTVELNPVSPTDLGMTARVTTTFDNSAWQGLYDIDLGTGTLLELHDNHGNVVKDWADGSDVMSGFPWHLAAAGTWTDNYVESMAAMTAWDVISTGPVRRNRFVNSTVNFTGAPAGATVTDNVVHGSTLNVTATAALTLASVELREGANVTSNTTGNFALLGSTHDGGTFSATNGQTVSVQDSTFTTSTLTLAGAGGTASIITSTFNASTVNRNAACTGAVNFTGTRCESVQFQQGAGCTTGTLNVSSSTLFLGIHKQNGNGNLSVGSSYISSGNIVVNGSRGITVQRSHGTFSGTDSSLVSNRTGGTAADVFTDMLFTEPTITLNGAVDPGGLQTIMNGGRIEFSSLTVTDPGVLTVLQSTEITGQSQVNIQAGAGLHDRCRFAAGALYNSGAFSAQSSIIDGAFTITAAGVNTNRLTNKSFSDWIV